MQKEAKRISEIMDLYCECVLRKEASGTVYWLQRAPDVVARKQQRRRPDCANAQSDLRICCTPSLWLNSLPSYIQSFSYLAFVCG